MHAALSAHARSYSSSSSSEDCIASFASGVVAQSRTVMMIADEMHQMHVAPIIKGSRKVR
jgi:hypothetical protein